MHNWFLIVEEGFSSGRHYFEIKIEEIGDAFSPGIGLCRMPSKQAARKGDLSVMGWSWFPALQSKYVKHSNLYITQI